MITQDRQYRNFEIRAMGGFEHELEESMGFMVEGYAAVFEKPTVIFEMDGVEYKEVIDRNAFINAEMRDVVMNFDHEGRPFARTKNGTLTLSIDDYGLKVVADLKSTRQSQGLYDDIKSGLIDKMSFAFTIAEQEFDKATRTLRITRIKRLYDVACVSIPAYDQTSISARSLYQAEAERELAEARELKKRKLMLLLEMEAKK